MSQLLELSAGILDGTIDPDATGPVNRINFQLSTISDRVALVEAFSHCILFETDDGLLGFDTSSVQGGARVVSAIRAWRKAPFHTLIYTHGHIDHVGGCGAFMNSAKAHGHAPVVCHQLAADHRIPDLRADGLGHLGVARATFGADAAF